MEIIDEAIARWHEMAKTVDKIDLTKSCEAPCNATFASNCIALCFLGLESPFEEGGELDCLWQDMMYFYRAWRDHDGTGDCAYKKRFIRFAQSLVSAHRRCPFEDEEVEQISFEDLMETELEEAEKEDIASGTYVSVAEHVTNNPPRRFFNVLRRLRKGENK